MADERKTYRRTLTHQLSFDLQMKDNADLNSKFNWLKSAEPNLNIITKKQTTQVASCVFTPDEKLAVIGLKSGDIILTYLEDNMREEVLEGHSEEVRALVTDGKILISGGNDKKLQVWDLKERSIIRVNISHTDKILSACLSKKIVYCSGQDGDIIRWQWEEDIEHQPIKLGHNKAYSMAVVKQHLLIGGSNSNLTVWDTKTLKEVAVCKGHDWPITCLSVSSDESVAVTSSMDHSVRMWNLKDFELKAVIDIRLEIIQSVAISVDSKYIVYGGRDGIISIAESSAFNKKNIIELPVHDAKINCVAVSRSAKYILSGSADKTYKLLEISESPKEYYLTGPEQSIKALKFSSDSNYIAAASEDKHIYVWRTGISEYEYLLDGHKEPVRFLDLFTKNSSSLLCVSASTDGKLVVWDVFEECKLTELTIESIWGLLVTPSYILVGTDYNKILFLDINSYTHVETITDLNTSTRTLCCSVRKQQLYCGGSSKIISVWSLSSFQEITFFKDHKAEVTSLATTSDETVLLSTARDGTIRLWDLTAFWCISVLRCSEENILKIDITSDDRYFITVTNSSLVKLWSLENKVFLGVLYEKRSVYAAAFAPNNRYLAFSSESKLVVARTPFSASKEDNFWVVPYKYSYIFKNILYDLLTKQKHTIDPLYANYTLIPWNLNLMHVLAYMNFWRFLRSLIADGASFIRTQTGETPLTISLEAKNLVCIDVIIEAFPSYILKYQPDSAELVREDLGKLSTLTVHSLHLLYNCLMAKVENQRLPTYGVFASRTPIIKASPTQEVVPSLYLKDKKPNQLTEFEVEFRQTRVQLDLGLGSRNSIAFFRSLQKCKNLEIFGTNFIKTIMLYKWRQIQYVIWTQAIVYAYMLGELTYYSLSDMDNVFTIARLCVLNAIFLVYELIQLVGDPWIYVQSTMNMLDLTRISIFYIFILLVGAGAPESNLRFVLAPLVTLSWLRLLAYIRMFDGTRYLIKMMIEIVKDMGPFLLVLVLAGIAFYMGFYVAAEGENTVRDLILHSYTLAYANFDTKSYSNLEFVIFYFASLLMPLIMLNLVIAIMSDTFSRVRGNLDVVDRKEMVEIFLEIDSICFWGRNRGTYSYIQRCDQPLSSVKTKDLWKNALAERVEKLNKRMKEMDKKIENINQDILVLTEIAKRNNFRTVLGTASDMVQELKLFKQIVIRAVKKKNPIEPNTA